MKLFALVFLISSSAFAGTWTCETGLDGKIIYHMTVKGDEQGHLISPATVSVAGLPGGPLNLMDSQAEAGEMGRYIIGYEDPRSKTRLRLMNEEVAPNTYKAYTLLVNFSIKQEFEGTCAYAP